MLMLVFVTDATVNDDGAANNARQQAIEQSQPRGC